MEEFEKILSQLPDMEMISPNDRLSRLITRAADAKADDELDEDNLTLVSAAGARPYQEFLKRLGKLPD